MPFILGAALIRPDALCPPEVQRLFHLPGMPDMMTAATGGADADIGPVNSAIYAHIGSDPVLFARLALSPQFPLILRASRGTAAF
ncbi:hypothetical protein GCM10011317_37420 [Niveispirillum cyanobacteriorum]|nr:hypothetical protein GCM10011317_37420 [Niveispirillum cyanobacteriorum]